MSSVSPLPTTPDGRLLLRTQAHAAAEEIRRTGWLIARQPVADTLPAAIRTDLADELTRQRTRLQQLLAEIEGDLAVDECWRRLADVRAGVAPLLAECEVAVTGALMRADGIGSDTCGLADGLLEDVSRRANVPWGRFTVLARREHIGEHARIIGLRFPEPTVWSLPIALHELGHHALPQLGRETFDGFSWKPFETLLDDATRSAGATVLGVPPERTQQVELLADAFAVYTGGPAFALACSLLRFDPRHATAGTHPGDHARVQAVLRGLELLDEAHGPALADSLRAQWAADVVASTEAEPVADPGIDAHAERAHGLFEQWAPQARFDGWGRAALLAGALRDGGEEQPSAQLRPWDVVNAGWLARVRSDLSPDELHQLGDRTARTCRAVLAR